MVLLLLMENNNYLNHANHNKEVCKYLDNNTGYNDWIVTTAFYSSIYYCDYKIFPFSLNNQQTGGKDVYNSLDDYYRFFKRTNNKSKHFCRYRLVFLYLNNISRDFKKLWDLSYYSRYLDYKIDKELSKQAVDILENIKKKCT